MLAAAHGALSMPICRASSRRRSPAALQRCSCWLFHNGHRDPSSGIVPHVQTASCRLAHPAAAPADERNPHEPASPAFWPPAPLERSPPMTEPCFPTRKSEPVAFPQEGLGWIPCLSLPADQPRAALGRTCVCIARKSPYFFFLARDPTCSMLSTKTTGYFLQHEQLSPRRSASFPPRDFAIQRLHFCARSIHFRYAVFNAGRTFRAFSTRHRADIDGRWTQSPRFCCSDRNPHRVRRVAYRGSRVRPRDLTSSMASVPPLQLGEPAHVSLEADASDKAFVGLALR